MSSYVCLLLVKVRFGEISYVTILTKSIFRRSFNIGNKRDQSVDENQWEQAVVGPQMDQVVVGRHQWEQAVVGHQRDQVVVG